MDETAPKGKCLPGGTQLNCQLQYNLIQTHYKNNRQPTEKNNT